MGKRDKRTRCDVTNAELCGTGVWPEPTAGLKLSTGADCPDFGRPVKAEIGSPVRLDKCGLIGEHNVMPHSNFDIQGLARYLHLAPQQVAKLADRGKLPGRKVGGEWRFAKADIHHWLENQIGLSDEGELIEVEGVLQRSAAGKAHGREFRSPKCCPSKQSPSRWRRGRETR